MKRIITALGIFTVIAGWGSAQSLTVSDHLKLLKSNRNLLVELVDEGVRMSRANTPLERAERCQKVAGHLSRQIRQASDRNDADRIVELSGHLATIVETGLVPNLTQARDQIPVGSPGWEQIQLIQRNTVENLTVAMPTDASLAKNPLLRETRQKLAALSDQLRLPE